ncbi:hypothetical protein ADUPG1_010331 [Aduncisulcus paluster]|uniref:Uncharacterized protein n=1 Tax=Aduncisulcus paluster TaxID=2918883 RepID=A0ABQ5JQY7_9EUKA|nr:hypothetical protein ADUPG1_010331 [Aduncisulcus paluster]
MDETIMYEDMFALKFLQEILSKCINDSDSEACEDGSEKCPREYRSMMQRDYDIPLLPPDRQKLRDILKLAISVWGEISWKLSDLSEYGSEEYFSQDGENLLMDDSEKIQERNKYWAKRVESGKIMFCPPNIFDVGLYCFQAFLDEFSQLFMKERGTPSAIFSKIGFYMDRMKEGYKMVSDVIIKQFSVDTKIPRHCPNWKWNVSHPDICSLTVEQSHKFDTIIMASTIPQDFHNLFLGSTFYYALYLVVRRMKNLRYKYQKGKSIESHLFGQIIYHDVDIFGDMIHLLEQPSNVIPINDEISVFSTITSKNSYFTSEIQYTILEIIRKLTHFKQFKKTLLEKRILSHMVNLLPKIEYHSRYCTSVLLSAVQLMFECDSVTRKEIISIVGPHINSILAHTFCPNSILWVQNFLYSASFQPSFHDKIAEFLPTLHSKVLALLQEGYYCGKARNDNLFIMSENGKDPKEIGFDVFTGEYDPQVHDGKYLELFHPTFDSYFRLIYMMSSSSSERHKISIDELINPVIVNWYVQYAKSFNENLELVNLFKVLSLHICKDNYINLALHSMPPPPLKLTKVYGDCIPYINNMHLKFCELWLQDYLAMYHECCHSSSSSQQHHVEIEDKDLMDCEQNGIHHREIAHKMLEQYGGDGMVNMCAYILAIEEIYLSLRIKIVGKMDKVSTLSMYVLEHCGIHLLMLRNDPLIHKLLTRINFHILLCSKFPHLLGLGKSKWLFSAFSLFLRLLKNVSQLFTLSARQSAIVKGVLIPCVADIVRSNGIWEFISPEFIHLMAKYCEKDVGFILFKFFKPFYSQFKKFSQVNEEFTFSFRSFCGKIFDLFVIASHAQKREMLQILPDCIPLFPNFDPLLLSQILLWLDEILVLEPNDQIIRDISKIFTFFALIGRIDESFGIERIFKCFHYVEWSHCTKSLQKNVLSLIAQSLFKLFDKWPIDQLTAFILGSGVESLFFDDFNPMIFPSLLELGRCIILSESSLRMRKSRLLLRIDDVSHFTFGRMWQKYIEGL